MHKTYGGPRERLKEVAVAIWWAEIDGSTRSRYLMCDNALDEINVGVWVWISLRERKGGVFPDLKLNFLWELWETGEGWC